MSPTKRFWGGVFNVVAALAFLSAGLWILNWSAGMLRTVRQSESWPDVEGSVTSSGIKRGENEIHPEVGYNYFVNGTWYQSRKIGFDIFDQPGGRGLPETIAKRYPVVSTVTVHYKSDAPSEAVLETGNYSPFMMPIVFGLLFVASGAWSAHYAWKLLTSTDEELAVEPDVERRRRTWTTLQSVLVYVILVIVELDPRGEEISAKAFGRPFGLPSQLFAVLLVTLLYLPVPWFFWHGNRIVQFAVRDGVVALRPLALLRYFLTADARHPELRSSQVICLCGILYFFILVAIWIAYCSVLGI